MVMSSPEFDQMLPYAPDEPERRRPDFGRGGSKGRIKWVIGALLVAAAFAVGGVVGVLAKDDGGSDKAASDAADYVVNTPKSPFVVPKTTNFQPSGEVPKRFTIKERAVSIASAKKDASDLVINDADAVGIVGTIRAASTSTALAVRIQDDQNYWALTPAPAYGAFGLTRIEDGEVKKRFTLKLTPSDPGTAVALVDAPDRVQVVVKGRVQLEVMTAELADSNRVGLLAVGPEAGSWSAIAVWG